MPSGDSNVREKNDNKNTERRKEIRKVRRDVNPERRSMGKEIMPAARSKMSASSRRQCLRQEE